MTRGVVLVAHNNADTNYVEMATYTAKRVNDFLKLPVTLVTDSTSVITETDVFEKIILTDANTSNSRKKSIWINKGRFKVFELSPYNETIVIDVDYMINSNKLNQLFEFDNDFMCHKNTFWLMDRTVEQEKLSKKSMQSLWATVIKFKKTSRTEQIFNMIEMVESNYLHYSNIYGFIPSPYRNDYALTIALKTVNGHLERLDDYIPWPLVHVNSEIGIERISNTSYNLYKSENNKKWYMQVSDYDFHMLNKKEFKNLMI
jgi:hypothetical protein